MNRHWWIDWPAHHPLGVAMGLVAACAALVIGLV